MIGSTVSHYRILSHLGTGGMGEVYRAHDTQLGRDVALKLLPQAFGNDADRLARFRREAHVLASLNHPNIAAIYGLDEDADQLFLVLELVEGEDLASRLRRGAMPVDDAIAAAMQIAAALEAAHEKHIVHRDLKPANVKLAPDGNVKVLDFGLAKALDPTVGGNATPPLPDSQVMNSPTMTSPAMTRMGMILGTAAYMSPEQARGRPVDKRADIWAFGCVLYEMLTGARPFAGDTVTDILAAVVTNDPDWSRLSETPLSIRRLLHRCLQKDPKNRLHDIADARLEMSDRDVEFVAQPAAPAKARGSTRWIAAAALVALAAGAAGGVLWRGTRDSAPPQWTGARLGGPAVAMDPRVSPDGQLLAFQAMVDGQAQVAVMKPGTGDWTVLTRDRTHGEVDMHSWSADGARIYYDRVTDSPQGIYSVPALGGDERLVIENAASPQPLADGSLLLLRINAARQLQLHRLWPGTGRLEALPIWSSTQGGSTGFRPLRDGRVVVAGRLLSGHETQDHLYVLRLDSGETRRIGQDLALDFRAGLAVTPDSAAALLAVREGSAYRVLRIPVDGRSASQPILTFLSRLFLDMSRDGAIYVSLMDRPIEIVRFRDAGGAVETMAAGPNLAAEAVSLPDGRALVAERVGAKTRVLIVSSGKDPVALVDTEEDTQWPMTAVGATQAALMIGSGIVPEIAIVAVDSGRIVKRLKAPAGLTSLAASPDGKTLYFASGGSVSALSVDGGEPRTIGQGDSLTVDAAIGDLIVKLDELGGIRLVRLSPGGGTPRPIDIRGDLRLVPEALLPGAVRNGRLVLPVASPDSWYWYAGALDLQTGRLGKIGVNYFTDFHGVTWAADGRVIGTGIGVQSALWRFTPVK